MTVLVLSGSDYKDTYFSYTPERDLMREWLESPDLIPSAALVEHLVVMSAVGGYPASAKEVEEHLDLRAAVAQEEERIARESKRRSGGKGMIEDAVWEGLGRAFFGKSAPAAPSGLVMASPHDQAVSRVAGWSEKAYLVSEFLPSAGSTQGEFARWCSAQSEEIEVFEYDIY